MSIKFSSRKVLTNKTLDDLTNLSSIMGDYVLYYEKCSPNGEKCFFTAYDDQTLVGFLSFLWIPTETSAELTAFVIPEFRRQGIYTTLLKNARKYSQKLGIQTFIYLRNDDNHFINGSFSHSEMLMKIDSIKSVSFEAYQDNFRLCIKNDTKSGNTTYTLYNSSKDEVCHCNLEMEASFVNLWGVYTMPKMRNKGYATLLINKALCHHFENDAKKPVILHVSSLNAPAVHIYEKIGFTVIEQIDYHCLPQS